MPFQSRLCLARQCRPDAPQLDALLVGRLQCTLPAPCIPHAQAIYIEDGMRQRRDSIHQLQIELLSEGTEALAKHAATQRGNEHRASHRHQISIQDQRTLHCTNEPS
jgi:hypothetical protein